MGVLLTTEGRAVGRRGGRGRQAMGGARGCCGGARAGAGGSPATAGSATAGKRMRLGEGRAILPVLPDHHRPQALRGADLDRMAAAGRERRQAMRECRRPLHREQQGEHDRQPGRATEHAAAMPDRAGQVIPAGVAIDRRARPQECPAMPDDQPLPSPLLDLHGLRRDAG
jgi:hypothetical protein